MSFQQSLRPMLLWMRFIGVFLESPGSEGSSPSTRIGIWITCYGFLFFFANVFCNGLQINQFFTNITEHLRMTSAVSVWSAAISTLNLASMTICSQLCLMSSAATKWPALMQILCKLERDGFFESRDYQKFRRIFLAGLISMMVFGVVVMAVVIIPVWTVDWPVYKKLQVCIPPFCLLFVFSGGALFSSLGWMASSMLDILSQQVYRDNNNSSSQKEERENWVKRIDTWRHRHHLITSFVDEINCCYGPLLLVLITSAFVQMITFSYETMRNITENPLSVLITSFPLLCIQFFFFLALIYAPHRLRESAVHFSKQLRCVELGASVVDNDYKIDLFAMNVLNSLPKITALGFFEVNLQLAPTLIGTTLTYLIILCQFQFSNQTK